MKRLAYSLVLFLLACAAIAEEPTVQNPVEPGGVGNHSGSESAGAVATEISGEPTPAALSDELQILEDVQAGLVLALAACAEEAHCVTALNEQEMQRMRDDLNELLVSQELPANDPLRQRYRSLIEQQEQLQQTVVEVIADVDRDALEGAWADQFVIDEIVVGPQVPFPNAGVPLSRFEDLNQPLPIE